MRTRKNQEKMVRTLGNKYLDSMNDEKTDLRYK